MKKLRTVVVCLICFLLAPPVNGAVFYDIDSISSSTAFDDLIPASNLIQGPGIGFDASEPHSKLLGGFDGNWVTAAPGGFPSDYIEVAGSPVLFIDLGQDNALSEISIWGYESSNAVGVSEFSLEFAAAADGAGGFGTSIVYNPSFFPTNDNTIRQSFAFDQDVTARYVEFTVLDNFFVAPGDGSVETPGGDRVGLGEIAFAISTSDPTPPTPIPAPGALLLLCSGLTGLAGYGRFGQRKKI